MKNISKKCCLMFLIFVITFVNTLPVKPVYAADIMTVDCGSVLRGVTHCASGSLYGITEATPADVTNLVEPLKPYLFTNPPYGGPDNQHPFGDGITVAGRLKGTVPSAKVMFILADMCKNWPYNFPDMTTWLNNIKAFVSKVKSSGNDNYYGYQIWNEPDGTWNIKNGTFEDMWLKTFNAIRSVDPSAKIVGPAYASYNHSKMSNFLDFCKKNNCLPDIINWHELYNIQSLSGHMTDYRALETSLGINPLPICINEYCDSDHKLEGQPGSSARFIGKFERYKVDSACISWWFNDVPGRLGSLLATNTQKGAGWYFYKWYGDMTGNMVSVTPPNDASIGIDGAACVDSSAKYISFIMGGPNSGTVTTTFKNIPSFIGSTASVKVEKVDWVSKDTVCNGTTEVATKNFKVSDGQITLTMKGCNASSGYRIYITPGTDSVTPDTDTDIVCGNTNIPTTGTIKSDAVYTYYEAESEKNTLAGTAKVASVSNCSGGSVVGYIGKGSQNTIQFNDIKVKKKGTYKIKMYYCSAETRNVTITVNNGKTIELTGLNSGDWYKAKEVEFKVSLKKGTNVIKLSNASAYAPDIDYIAVSNKPVK